MALPANLCYAQPVWLPLKVLDKYISMAGELTYAMKCCPCKNADALEVLC